jgi:hypothetical protein
MAGGNKPVILQMTVPVGAFLNGGEVAATERSGVDRQ